VLQQPWLGSRIKPADRTFARFELVLNASDRDRPPRAIPRSSWTRRFSDGFARRASGVGANYTAVVSRTVSTGDKGRSREIRPFR